jgi:hypothetical protein
VLKRLCYLGASLTAAVVVGLLILDPSRPLALL